MIIRHKACWLLLAALLVTAGIYWPGLSGGWLFDDYPNIVDNPGVHPFGASVASMLRAALSSPASEFKRPLASLSFAANYLVSGLNPYRWKLTNLFIHLMNGVLVFLLSRALLLAALIEAHPVRDSSSPGSQNASRTTEGSPLWTGGAPTSARAGIIAAIIAGAWMVLPINLTAVLYVVQRMESLANLFVLLGLIGYVAGRRRMLASPGVAGSSLLVKSDWLGFMLCLASITLPTLFGMLAKETAVVLPLYALLVEWAIFRWRKRGSYIVDEDFPSREILATAPQPDVGRALPADTSPDGSRHETAGSARPTRAAQSRNNLPRKESAGSARPTGMVRHGKDWRVITLFLVALALPMLVGLSWLVPGLLKPVTWATRDFTLGTRLLSEARIVTDYIGWTLRPTPDALSFYHDDFRVSTDLLTPWTTLTSIGFLATLTALTFWLRPRQPLTALGIALFLGCQLLTGTILPLELIYEHRNYFASFGLLLTLVPLMAAPARARQQVMQERSGNPWRIQDHGLPFARSRYVLLVGMMICWTALTAVTAYAWGNPLRLAEELASRAPDSPRAQYELGRTYIIYSHYDPASPFTRLAYAPLEASAALPDSSILPEQALIFMNARMQLPLKDAWWDSMIDKLKARSPGVQDESSLAALSQCVRDRRCDLPAARMIAAFRAALAHPKPTARLLATYGNYAWQSLDDHALGEQMTRQAISVSPDEPAYQITLVRMLVAQGRKAEARSAVQKLEKLNLGGQLDDELSQLRRFTTIP